MASLNIMAAGAACFLGSFSFAQQKQLTDDQYFKNNFKGIMQALPNATRWMDNSHVLLVRDGKTYVLDAKTGTETEATDGDRAMSKVNVPVNVFIKDKDLFLRGSNDAEIRLTNDTMPEINPTVSPDGKYVAFTRMNDLYSIDLASKKETRITNDGSDVILNGYASWVYTEEILGRASHYRSFWWSPDSKKIAFFRTDDSPVPLYTITDGGNGSHGYVETERYPKVGDKNPEVKIGIANPVSGAIVWVAFNEKDDQYFGAPYWTVDGSSLWVQWMNRKQNDLKIYAVDPVAGSKKELYDETQKTWVQLEDGYERLHFLKSNKNFILESDKTGWNNLYLYDMAGQLVNPLTPGKFTVTDINYIDETKSIVYFSARKENTARKDLYRVNFNGKNMQRLTFGEYNHGVINISPDGSYFVTTYSNAVTPPRMTLVSNTGKIIKEIADAKGADMNNYALAKTEIVRVISDDGLYGLPMKVTWPINFDKNKKYPVLISIYGGPNAGTVMDTWSLGGVQQFYAKEGLIQVAMDHRASGHFGKEGVNYMYHDLGHWEMTDYITMVKWLIANGGADPKKICITGFSYGGYMTCYALTHFPDVFSYGMAGGSVTDWRLYDTHYTERYMGTPADNPDGYQTSSVLAFANNYRGGLQIVHGVIDDNVHVANSLQLISKLEDAKKDFEFMLYPTGRHGWPGNKNLHFMNLKTKFIYRYLLEKPVPKEMLK